MPQRLVDPQVAEEIAARLSLTLKSELGALTAPEIPVRTPACLAAAARVIRQANTQGEALRGLLSGAGSLGWKAALFVVRQDQLEGWEAYGLSGASLGPLTRIRLSAAHPGIAAALETHTPVAVGGAHELPVPDFGQDLPPQAWLVPLMVQEKAAAVLYAEPAGDRPEPDMAGLETLAEMTGLSIDRLVYARAGQRTPAAARPAGGPPTGPVQTSIPVAVPAAAPAAAPEVQDARRYARLLMEDIVLYHPEKVDEGRAQHTLLTRLADEIARARQAYNQRVPDEVRAQGDFFEEALVRVLAGGNQEALGTPAPQVS